MAEILPHPFLRSNEAAVASYNYTDIADGTGIVKYFLAKTATNGGNSFVLTQNDFYASGASTSTSTTTTIDAFEVTFNRPQSIKGKAIANVLYGFTVASGGAGNATIAVILEKESAGSDTTIASATSDTRTSGTAGSFNYSQVAIPLDITSKIHFKKGDKLKLQVTATISSGSSPTFLIMHDPSNARGVDDAVANDFTDSALYIPFVIDL